MKLPKFVFTDAVEGAEFNRAVSAACFWYILVLV